MKYLITESQLIFLTDNLKKTIINFVTKKIGRDDLKFKVQLHHEKIYIIVVVDCLKMDKNTPQFDESYFRFMTREDEDRPLGINFGWESGFLDKITKKFYKGTGIKLYTHFGYENYEYTDEMRKKIQNAVNRSSCPEVQVEFSGSGERPKLTLGFYNVPTAEMNEQSKFQDFIEELETIMENKIDLHAYSIMKTMGDLK